MDMMTMIVVVIAMVAAFILIVTRMAFKHEESQMQSLKGKSANDSEFARLESILAANQTEMAKLRDRVQVLERLVTDEDRNLAGEIDRLKSQPRV
jgi:uncharacterized protein YlxW (UPF0749 family)